MATVTLNNVAHIPPASYCTTPWGNALKIEYNLTTNSSGVIAASDQATALITGDIIKLGIIPAGMRLIDYLMIVSNAGTAAGTGKVGFQYVDGVDSAAVPEDDDYFCAATALSSAAITRKTATTAPVTLPKDAYLILTHESATQDEAMVVDIILDCINIG